MADIVQFTPKARSEEKPDPEHIAVIFKNGEPEKWFEFAVSFKDGAAEYSFHIWARDIADAARRVGCIRESAALDGQLFSSFPYV